MKKLKLKLDGMKEMLTKEQMKKITGGSATDNANCRAVGKHACYCSFTFVECVDSCDDNCLNPLENDDWWRVCAHQEIGQFCS